MGRLTVSYGLVPPVPKEIPRDAHILSPSQIIYVPGDTTESEDGELITCSRDGSVILHGNKGPVRVQAHSDWITQIAQIGDSHYITVSHDFAIVLLTLIKDAEDAPPIWEYRMVGEHDDYIKSVVTIGEECTSFATAGLDKCIKLWSTDELYNVELMHTFDLNMNPLLGSIYCVIYVSNQAEYDLVACDCNGNVIFLSTIKRTIIESVYNAHDSHIKLLHVLDDHKRFLSASADGTIKLWDSKSRKSLKDIKWDCSVWSLAGEYSNDIHVGDSKGHITHLNIDLDHRDVTFDPEQYEDQLLDNISTTALVSKQKVPRGVVNIMRVPKSNKLIFSFASNANLYTFDQDSGKLSIKYGGFALTRSSLLTNRRHVITENTIGQIQRWDIVSCELIDTFDSEIGNFDEIVAKYTSKEILSHWCTVQVKVGILFVKISPKFLDTEIYGSALRDYKLVNEVDLNDDERYNLGLIVMNSIFNEFINYEIGKDKIYRKSLASRKSKGSLDNFNSNKESVTSVNSNALSDIDMVKDCDPKHAKKTFSFGKRFQDKQSQIDLSQDPATTSSIDMHENTESRDVVGTDNDIPTALYKTPNNTDDQMQSTSLNKAIRSTGSSLILTRKFKSFKNSSSSLGKSQNMEPSVAESIPVESSNHAITKTGNDTNTLSADERTSDHNHSQNNNKKKSLSLAVGRNNSKVTHAGGALKTRNTKFDLLPKVITGTPGSEFGKEESMLDLICELQEGYKKQYEHTASSLKFLSKRVPDSKMRRDLTSPIIQVKNGTLLLIHCWKEGSCGGRVLFSSFLPASNPQLHVELDNVTTQDNEENELVSLNENLGKYDYTEYEFGNALNRKQLFEQMEKYIPYWFAKMLFLEHESNNRSIQPKLNFVITPWLPNEIHDGDDTEKLESSGHEVVPPTPTNTSFYQLLKLSNNNQEHTVMDLPKIAEANVKLIAPGMVKVKKIKTYVVDRFESRTPEMKAKIEPGEWLDLICKEQVLDNDMTLSTVRSLYWKSQGDIILKYRRKSRTPYTAANEGNNGSPITQV